LGRLCCSRASHDKLDQIAVSDRGDSGVYHNCYHNSSLPAQPLACKLLILKTRRDVRVVEGARLESVFCALSPARLACQAPSSPAPATCPSPLPTGASQETSMKPGCGCGPDAKLTTLGSFATHCHQLLVSLGGRTEAAENPWRLVVTNLGYGRECVTYAAITSSARGASAPRTSFAQE
jgi:hypothetical protein